MTCLCISVRFVLAAAPPPHSLPQMRGAFAATWKTLRPLSRLNGLAKKVPKKERPLKKRLKPVAGGLVIHQGSCSPYAAAPVSCSPYGPTRLPLKSARLRSHEQHQVKQVAALMKHVNLERSCTSLRTFSSFNDVHLVPEPRQNLSTAGGD